MREMGLRKSERTVGPGYGERGGLGIPLIRRHKKVSSPGFFYNIEREGWTNAHIWPGKLLTTPSRLLKLLIPLPTDHPKGESFSFMPPFGL